MTLLLTLIAAVISTLVWYTSPKARELHVGALLYMFWGAALMWMADAIFEFAELGAEYFTPSMEDMLDDSFLGISVIVLALVIWVAILLVKDPLNSVKGLIKARN